MKKQNINNTLELLENIGLLKKVVRTGWVLKGVNGAESVAEHTYRVAIMAMLFAPEHNLDQLKLIKMALIHDLGEVFIGDIKWETGKKIVGQQKEKHRDEKKAIKEMFKRNIDYQEFVKLWKEFNDQKTEEAKLLKEIDKLEMAAQAYEYEKNGHDKEKLDEFWDNAKKYLAGGKLESVFKKLQRKRSKL